MARLLCQIGHCPCLLDARGRDFLYYFLLEEASALSDGFCEAGADLASVGAESLLIELVTFGGWNN